MANYLKFTASLTSLTLLALTTSPTSAQNIIPNPETNTIITQDNQLYTITGGALSADQQNLFHKFQEFNLDLQDIADFQTNPNLSNLVIGIDGGTPSLINGLIQLSGSQADVYFLNPSGVIFGTDAALNLPADFTVSTANRLGFDQNNSFNVLSPNNYESLIGNPESLFFDTSQPSSIINDGELTLDNGTLSLYGGGILHTGKIDAGNATLQSVEGSTATRILPKGGVLGFEVDLPTDDQGNFNIQSFGLGELREFFLQTNEIEIHQSFSRFSRTSTNESIKDSTVLEHRGNFNPFKKPRIPPTTQNVLDQHQSNIPQDIFLSATTSVIGDINTSSQVQRGGDINILGDIVILDQQANLVASGALGGGNINIGGNYQGKGDLPNAQVTFIGKDVSLNADAIAKGNGGDVIVWADDRTGFFGTLSSRGGEVSGDGGFAEISGKNQLIYRGSVDLSAINGNFGTLLFDPVDIIIADGSGDGDDSDLSTTFFDSNPLDSNSLPNTFTIFESELEGLSGDTNIILSATNDIILEDLSDGELFLPRGSGTITFTADADGDKVGDFIFRDNLNDEIRALDRDITITAASVDIGQIETFDDTSAGNVTITTTSGDLIINRNIRAFADSGNANKQAGGVVDLNAFGNLNVNCSDGGGVCIETFGGDITLNSMNGGIFISSGNINSGIAQTGVAPGDITITAKKDIELANVSSGFAADALATGTQSFENAGDITIRSTEGSISLSGSAVNNTGEIFASATDGLGGQIDISAARDLSIAGRIRSEGSSTNNTPSNSITLTASNGALSAGDITSSGFNSGDIILTAGTDISAGTLLSNPNAGDSGTITVNATGDLTLNGTDDSGSVFNGVVAAFSSNNSGGTIDLKAGGNINLDCPYYCLRVGEDADNAALLTNVNHGSISVDAGGSINLQNIYSDFATDTTLETTLPLFIDASNNSGNGGVIQLKAGSNIEVGTMSVSSSGISSSAGSITIISETGSVDTTAPHSPGLGDTVLAGRTLGTNTASKQSSAGSLRIEAAKDITTGFIRFWGTQSGGTIDLMSEHGGTIDTTAGQIETFSQEDAEAGTIKLDTDGIINLGAINDIALINPPGDTDIQTISNASGANLTLNSATTNLFKNIDVSGNSPGGLIKFENDVVLQDSVNIIGDRVEFGGNIKSSPNSPQSLTITTGGNVTFLNAIGTTTDPLAGLTITASQVDIDQNLIVDGDLVIDALANIRASSILGVGTNSINLNGGLAANAGVTLELEADNFALGGGFSGDKNNILIRPGTESRHISIGLEETNALSISNNEFTSLNEFASVEIGRADGTGNININAAIAPQNPLTLRTRGNINANANITGADGAALTLDADNFVVSTETISTNGDLIINASANIEVASTLSAGTNAINLNNGLTANAGVILEADNLALNGVFTGAGNTLTIRPVTQSHGINLGSEIENNLSLSDTEIGLLNGFSSIVVEGARDIDINAAIAPRDPLTLQTTGSINANANITGMDDASLTLGATNFVVNTEAISAAGDLVINALTNIEAASTLSAGTNSINLNGDLSANAGLTLEADNLAVAGNFTGRGNTLTIRPATLSRDITLGGEGANTLSLVDTEIVLLNGFSSIEVGRGDSTGDININAAIAPRDPLTLQTTGSINANANITGMDDASLTLGATNFMVNTEAISAAGDLVINALTNIEAASTLSAGTNSINLNGDLSANAELTLEADNLAFMGDFTGRGNTLTIRPATLSRDLTLGGEDANALSIADVGSFNGFSSVEIGRGDSTGDININAAIAPQDPLTLQTTGSINANANITGMDDASLALTATNFVVNTEAISTAGDLVINALTNIEVAATINAESNSILINNGLTANADVVLEADNISLAGTFFGNENTLQIRPNSVGRDISVGAEITDTLFISDSAIAAFDGFSQVSIGRTDGSGNISITANLTPQDPLLFQTETGSIFVNADIASIDDASLTLTAPNTTTTFNASNLTTTNQNITVNSSAVLGNNITFNSGSAAGNVFFNDAVTGAFSLGVIAGTGEVTFTQGLNVLDADLGTASSVNLGGNIETSDAGNLSLNQPLQLLNNVIIATTGGDININNTVDSQAGTNFSLTLNPSGGNLLLNGALGNTQALGGIATNNVQAIATNATINTVGDIAFNAVEDININAEITSNGGSITAQSTTGNITAQNLTTANAGGTGGNITAIALGNDQTVIALGDLDASGNIGGNINLQANQTVTAGTINARGTVGNGGNVTIDPEELTVTSIDAQGGAVGTGGNVDLTSTGFFQSTGGFVDDSGVFSSIATSGGTGSGSITIRHDGGDRQIPFIVGDASINGTAGALNTGDFIIAPNQVFPGSYFLGNISIITSDFFSNELAKALEDETEELEIIAQPEDDGFFLDEYFTRLYERYFVDNVLAADIPIKSLKEIKDELKAAEEATGIKPVLIYSLFQPNFVLENCKNQQQTIVAGTEHHTNILDLDSPCIVDPESQRNNQEFEDSNTESKEDILTLVMVTPDKDVHIVLLEEATRHLVEKTAIRFAERSTQYWSEKARKQQDYYQQAQNLYGWLVDPLEKLFRDEESNQEINLIFVPEYALRSVPFAALANSEKSHENCLQGQAKDCHFLIEEYSSGLMPSMSLTDISYQNIRNLSMRIGGASQIQDEPGLELLPEQLDTIEQLWSDNNRNIDSRLINDQFTVQALRKVQDEAPYGIVNLATHADFKENPTRQIDNDKSYIAFVESNPTTTDLLELDEVKLNDIRTLNLEQVKLLILNACETALGGEFAELGFAGFAHRAQVQSVLGSLWKVQEDATTTMMLDFFNNLTQNRPPLDPQKPLQDLTFTMTKAYSLRRAQESILNNQIGIRDRDQLIFGGNGVEQKNLSVGDYCGDRQTSCESDWSDPYYWSGFTMVGSPW